MDTALKTLFGGLCPHFGFKSHLNFLGNQRESCGGMRLAKTLMLSEMDVYSDMGTINKTGICQEVHY